MNVNDNILNVDNVNEDISKFLGDDDTDVTVYICIFWRLKAGSDFKTVSHCSRKCSSNTNSLINWNKIISQT